MNLPQGVDSALFYGAFMLGLQVICVRSHVAQGALISCNQCQKFDFLHALSSG